MKKAIIVSIGNEILSGLAVDTNTVYLCGKLLSVGLPVISSYVVGDDVGSIVRAFNRAGEEADVVLVTGGLGPTADDLTRQALAEFLGVELKLDEGLLREIQDFYARRDLQMPPSNKVQAYMPAGSKSLENKLGTAPGIFAEAKGKLFFVMPGVPLEMKQMFEESVFDELKRCAAGQAVVIKRLKCFGTGESNIAVLLGDLMSRGRNPLINCTAGHGVITLNIVSTAKDSDTAREMLVRDEQLIRDKLGELVFGQGEQTLAGVVGEELTRLNKKVAVAESCTGGIIAGLLTSTPGASKYFSYGWVTYSNDAKNTELAVPADLIEEHGAVSEQVAMAMAKGARKKGGTDFAIGVTGIAGPTGGSEDKPIGLVYICVASDKDYETKRFIFGQERALVRLRAALTALNMLRLKLQA